MTDRPEVPLPAKTELTRACWFHYQSGQSQIFQTLRMSGREIKSKSSFKLKNCLCLLFRLMKKAKTFWVQIHRTMQKIFQINITMKPELFLLGCLHSELERKYRKVILYMVAAARLSHAERWKNNEISVMEDLIII